MHILWRKLGSLRIMGKIRNLLVVLMALLLNVLLLEYCLI